MSDETEENPPYITRHQVTVVREFNPGYGDNRICKCGHHYYRHFDGYEDNRAVGCKYCDCYTFEEAALQKEPVALTKEDVLYKDHIGVCLVENVVAGIIIPVELISKVGRELSLLADKAEQYPEIDFIGERLKILKKLMEVSEEVLRTQYGIKP